MKFFIALFALAAVAFAEPEADPALLYSNAFGFNYGYSPLAYNSYAYAASPYIYGYRAYSPFYNYNHFGYRHFAKREAEADPALLYANNFGYNFAASPYAYRTAYSAPWAYNYAYAHAALPYAHATYAAAPAVAHVAAPATHLTQVNGAVSQTAALHSGAGIPGAYANAGQYVANSAGTVHVAKREAEADPAFFYSNYGYHYNTPFAYSGYAARFSPYSYGFRYGAYAAPHAYGRYYF